MQPDVLLASKSNFIPYNESSRCWPPCPSADSRNAPGIGASHSHMNQKTVKWVKFRSKGEVFHPDLSIFSLISTSFTHQESCKRQKGFGCYSWGPNKVVVTIILFSSVPFGKISKFEVKGTKPLDTIQCCPNCLLNSRPYSKVLVFIRLYITCFPLSIGNPFEFFPFEGKCFYRRHGWNEWTPLQLTIVLALISIAVLIISLFFSDSSAFSSGLNSFTSSWCQESRVRHFSSGKKNIPEKKSEKGVKMKSVSTIACRFQ